MTGTVQPFGRLTCAALILLPVAALVSAPFISQRLEDRRAEREAAAKANELYQRVVLAANEGDIDEAESALFDATSFAPDHPARVNAEAGVQQAKVDHLLLRAADLDLPAAKRREALLQLAVLDAEQQADWRERADALDDEVAEEQRQARAQAKIDAILAEADAEPEGGRYVPQREVLPQGFECGRKNSCKQMKSCAEAVAYFEKCGVQRLDPDNDGRPCENLCTWRDLDG